MKKRSTAGVSLFVILIAAIVICSACQPKGTKPIVNPMNPSEIAADSQSQQKMDLSYELQKTLEYNRDTVFDFMAYDRPEYDGSTKWIARYLLIRRTSTKSDTVIKGPRTGRVNAVWLSDMNHNAEPELCFYTVDPADKITRNVVVLEIDKNGKGREIACEWNKTQNQDIVADTFYNEKSYMVRRYAFKNSSGKTGVQHQYYALHGKEMRIEKEDSQ